MFKAPANRTLSAGLSLRSAPLAAPTASNAQFCPSLSPLSSLQSRSSIPSRSLQCHSAQGFPQSPNQQPIIDIQATNVTPEDMPASPETAPQPPKKALAPMPRDELIKRAIKLPMYSVAIIPILVAAACVYAQYGVINGLLTLGLMGAACSVIAWLNLSNDYFDADTGVDTTHKPESVVNLLGGKKEPVMALATAFLTTGLGCLMLLVQRVHDDRVFTCLTLAISLGYIYQGPPFRLSYRGLGEPLCFLAFGPLATSAFYLAQVPDYALTHLIPGALSKAGPAVPVMCIAAALLVGFTTSVILYCSHFHQHDGDKAVEKMSPIVRLGTGRAATLLRAVMVLYYAALGATIYMQWLPITALAAAAVSLPLAYSLVDLVVRHHGEPDRVKGAKFVATKWHIVHGVALAASIVAPKVLGL